MHDAESSLIERLPPLQCNASSWRALRDTVLDAAIDALHHRPECLDGHAQISVAVLLSRRLLPIDARELGAVSRALASYGIEHRLSYVLVGTPEPAHHTVRISLHRPARRRPGASL